MPRAPTNLSGNDGTPRGRGARRSRGQGRGQGRGRGRGNHNRGHAHAHRGRGRGQFGNYTNPNPNPDPSIYYNHYANPRLHRTPTPEPPRSYTDYGFGPLYSDDPLEEEEEDPLPEFDFSGGGYTPYVPPHIPAYQRCTFDGSFHNPNVHIPMDVPRLDANPYITSIRFGPTFHVEDVHLDAIRMRPALAGRLVELMLGDAETGCGGYISESGILDLAGACPNLVVLSLDAATSLTDTALQGICESCPNLQSLRITGHDRHHGGIQGSSLKFLADHPEIVPGLRELVLYDQSESKIEKPMTALSKKRKTLAIKTGDTGNREWDTGATFTMMDGKFVSIDIDDGDFFF